MLVFFHNYGFNDFPLPELYLFWGLILVAGINQSFQYGCLIQFYCLMHFGGSTEKVLSPDFPALGFIHFTLNLAKPARPCSMRLPPTCLLIGKLHLYWQMPHAAKIRKNWASILLDLLFLYIVFLSMKNGCKTKWNYVTVYINEPQQYHLTSHLIFPPLQQQHNILAPSIHVV